MISKIFEKLYKLNNRFVDHLEKGGLFSNFQYSFRSPGSTTDLLIVVSDIIAKVFNGSEVYDTLMTFLMLSARLISILMTLLPPIKVIRHLIYDNN